VRTHPAFPGALGPHAHIPINQKYLLCQVLPQFGAGGRGGSALFQAERDHILAPASGRCADRASRGQGRGRKQAN